MQSYTKVFGDACIDLEVIPTKLYNRCIICTAKELNSGHLPGFSTGELLQRFYVIVHADCGVFALSNCHLCVIVGESQVQIVDYVTHIRSKDYWLWFRGHITLL